MIIFWLLMVALLVFTAACLLYQAWLRWQEWDQLGDDWVSANPRHKGE